MIMPADVQEREDQLRSELKIRGMETIKSQTARNVIAFLEAKTHKKVNRKNPDLTVVVDMDKGSLLINAKSLFIFARYTKPKGVSQRIELCENCSGRGCDDCKGGRLDVPSMEEILGNKLNRILGSSKAKFTWIGSEDEDSVVYPPGRPFMVEVKNPRRRKVPSRLVVTTGRGRAEVTGAKALRERPLATPSFVFKTRAFIEPAEGLGGLKPSSVRQITGTTIRYRNNKGKDVSKRVYSIRVQRIRKRATAEIKLDGGLPVKRFVSGESVSPSLSEVLGIQLVCKKFDILRVWESHIA
jgi:tRNA pseudouridine synthase 10